ncbi:hypothetical protein LCGC14_0264650 [marine sediment metagenome]|uniref:Uncharacterized protein n=1 Tax=marine sediment metagenome TaxID=412755 RepID=A0A0F9UHS0_9ZZZZ
MLKLVGIVIAVLAIAVEIGMVVQINNMNETVDTVNSTTNKIVQDLGAVDVQLTTIEARLNVLDGGEETNKACLFGVWVVPSETFVIVYFDAGNPGEAEQMYLCGEGLGLKPRLPDGATLHNPEAIFFMQEFN